MLFSHGFNKVCLIPDSYRATKRNGNSISVDFTEYSIENDENDTFWQFDSCFWTFFTLQYKLINSLSLFLSAKQVRKVRQRLFFISVSNARTNKYYILRRCMYFVYLLFKRTESLCWREITVTQVNNIIFPRIDRPIQVPSFTVILFSSWI